MAAKKSKKVTIEVDAETLVKLAAAAAALSESANALISGVDDATVRAKLTKGSGKKK